MGHAVTHAHFDHTGAVPQLLKLYPNTPVVAHIKEAPFLTVQEHTEGGGQAYTSRTAALLSMLQTAMVVPKSAIKVSSLWMS